MKLFLFALALLSAHTAFADEYLDRENALKQKESQAFYLQRERVVAINNQKHVQLLGAFAARHGGQAEVADCNSGMVGWVVSQGEDVAAYEQFQAGRFSATMKYPSKDPLGLSEIDYCSVNMRDGLACSTELKKADTAKDGWSLYTLSISCISSSLKKTITKLGTLERLN